MSRSAEDCLREYLQIMVKSICNATVYKYMEKRNYKRRNYKNRHYALKTYKEIEMSCMNLEQYLYIFSFKKTENAEGSKEFRFWNNVPLVFCKIHVYNKAFSLCYLIHKSLAMQVTTTKCLRFSHWIDC